MATKKQSVVPDHIDPIKKHEVKHTEEFLAPIPFKRIEVVRTPDIVTYGYSGFYFRVYTKSLEVPNFVSITYPLEKECMEARKKYIETGEFDRYYVEKKTKKGKK